MHCASFRRRLFQRPTRFSHLTAIAVVAASLGLAVAPAYSQSVSWTGNAGNGSWGVIGNWNPTAIPVDSANVIFPSSGLNRTIDLGANRTVNSVSFTGASAYNLNNQTLTITSGNIFSNGATSHGIKSNVALGASGAWNLASTVDVTGNVTAVGGGAYGVTKQGGGTLRLAGATNNVHNLRVEGGTVNIDEGTTTLTSATSLADAAMWIVSSTVNIGHDATVNGTPTATIVVEGGAGGAANLNIDGEDTMLNTVGQIFVGIGGSTSANLTLTHEAKITGLNILAVAFGANPVASVVTIRDGSTMDGAAAAVGVASGATGTVTLQNPDTTWTTGFLGMGGYTSTQNGGTGTVTVTDRARLVVTGAANFFNNASSLVIDRGSATIGVLDNEPGVTASIRIRDEAGTPALTLNTPIDEPSYTWDGVISNQNNAGSLVKKGDGAQIFSKQQTYTGGTRIEAGTLTLGTTNTLVPTSAITVVGGTLDLGPNLQQAGAVTLQGGAISGAVPAVLLPTSLALQSGSLAVTTLTASTVSKTTTGAMTVSAPLSVNALNMNAGTLTCNAPLTASQVTVNAGTLTLNRGASANAQVNGGTLELAGTLSGNLTTSVGAVTLVGDAIVTGTASVLGPFNVGARTFINGTGTLTVENMTLTGGVVESTSIILNAITGSGTVLAPIHGQSQAVITAQNGILTLGKPSVGNAFDDFRGTINVGQAAVNLLSGGTAKLGATTTINQGFLNSLNGIQLPGGSTLSGPGEISGAFNNGGAVTGGSGQNFLYFYGPVTGGGSFAGNVQFENTYSPGNSPASVNFTGAAKFAASSQLDIELGGTTLGANYDHLDVADLALGGALKVSLIDDYVPAAGATFNILDWNSLTGQFSSIQLPAIPGLFWDASQLYVTGELKVVAPLSADFNVNGDVNAADYAAWQANFGASSATRAMGDANSNSFVDDFDFLQWQLQFGAHFLPGSVVPLTSAVPEPAASWLAAIAALAACRSSRPRTFLKTGRGM